MRIDLEDIESRINEGIYGDGQRCDSVLVQEDAFFALAEIIAEVERLRGEAERERASVVAWLKKQRIYCTDSTGEPNAVTATYAHAAEAVERGEHRREETK